MNKTKNLLTIALLGIFGFSNSVNAMDLADFIDESIEASPKIKALESAHYADLEAVKQEVYFWHPSLKYELEQNIKVENRAEARDSTITMRSNLLQGNRSDVMDGLNTAADISLLAVEMEEDSMKARILSSVYKIALFENLIEEGQRIIDEAQAINSDISLKVDGGLAKISDSTTAMVLLKEMESTILALQLRIDQLKIDLEASTGRPYPVDLTVPVSKVVAFVNQQPNTSTENNLALKRKRLEVKSARHAHNAADNWYSLDAYVKTEFNEYDFANKSTEIGFELTIDLINPSNYWNDRKRVHSVQSERYQLDQLERDVSLGLTAQINIFESNMSLWESLVESLEYKKSLIDERHNEYEINLTSLYELIQSWSSYYSTVQQKTDTEATLVDTMISSMMMSGDL
ncbi:conserved exported hypothetical protein [Vibrio chagasii]|nr:conserved exported hypothetical protein [Vibrio chagasii]